MQNNTIDSLGDWSYIGVEIELDLLTIAYRLPFGNGNILLFGQ